MNSKQLTRQERRRIMRKQRWMGVLLLVISALCLWLCSTGTTMADRDATAVLLVLPLGLYLIFTKQICIYG